MTKTRCGTLLDAEGLLCISQFEEVMRDQMKRFLQRQLTNTLAVQQFAGSEEVQLTIMKAILQEQVFAGKVAFFSSLDACSLLSPLDRFLKLCFHPFNLLSSGLIVSA